MDLVADGLLMSMPAKVISFDSVERRAVVQPHMQGADRVFLNLPVVSGGEVRAGDLVSVFTKTDAGRGPAGTHLPPFDTYAVGRPSDEEVLRLFPKEGHRLIALLEMAQDEGRPPADRLRAMAAAAEIHILDAAQRPGLSDQARRTAVAAFSRFAPKRDA